MSELDPNALLAGQRAAMVADGCGYTVNGEHVFCADPRVQDDHRQTECSCKRNATAAITAYLSTVSPLSDGDGWQPIETGQDGRRVDVLLTNGTVKYGVRWGEDEVEYDDREPGWVDDATGKFVRGEDEVFTHWRPSALPAPPLDELRPMNSTITDERLKEILDGCAGVTPGPYEVEQTAPGMCDMYVTAPNEGARRRRPIAIIAPQKREENAFHFARLDPETVAAMASELLAAREALSSEDAARHLTEVAQALWDRVEARRDKSNEAVTPAEQDDAAMAYGFDKAAESIRAMIAARALSGNRSGNC